MPALNIRYQTLASVPIRTNENESVYIKKIKIFHNRNED